MHCRYTARHSARDTHLAQCQLSNIASRIGLRKCAWLHVQLNVVSDTHCISVNILNSLSNVSEETSHRRYKKRVERKIIIPVDIKTFQTQLQIWPIVRRLTDRPLLPVAAQTSVSQTIRKPPLVKAQTAFLKIKYGEKRFSIRQMEFLHPVMWYDRDIDFAR